jgi:hypothetical protein
VLEGMKKGILFPIPPLLKAYAYPLSNKRGSILEERGRDIDKMGVQGVEKCIFVIKL